MRISEPVLLQLRHHMGLPFDDTESRSYATNLTRGRQAKTVIVIAKDRIGVRAAVFLDQIQLLRERDGLVMKECRQKWTGDRKWFISLQFTRPTEMNVCKTAITIKPLFFIIMFYLLLCLKRDELNNEYNWATILFPFSPPTWRNADEFLSSSLSLPSPSVPRQEGAGTNRVHKNLIVGPWTKPTQTRIP